MATPDLLDIQNPGDMADVLAIALVNALQADDNGTVPLANSLARILGISPEGVMARKLGNPVTFGDLEDAPLNDDFGNFWSFDGDGGLQQVAPSDVADFVHADLQNLSLETVGISHLLGLKSDGTPVRLAAPFKANIAATGRFGLQDAGGLFLYENRSAEPSVKVGIGLRTQSELTYSGGTPGNVLSLQWNKATVSANVADYVWAGLDILDNSATGGQNVARYAQGNKRAGAGPTWAAVFEMRDYDDSASGAVAVELDVFGNGSTNKANRIGIDLVAGKINAGGVAVGVGAGIRIGPAHGDANEATFDRGIQLLKNMTTGLEIANTGTWGILFPSAANLAVGIDLSAATYSAAALRLATDTRIQFTATGSISVGYEASGTKLTFKNNTTERVAFNMGNGDISVGGNKVMGARKTGWGTPAGTLNRSAYTSYAGQTVSATYSQAQVQALDDAVKLMSQTLTALLTDAHSATSGQGWIGT